MFLLDLAQAQRSLHTRRAYASDLAQFAATSPGPLTGITPTLLRAFFLTLETRQPTTRARQQATLASFFAWAYRQDLLAHNPMTQIQRVQPAVPLPRAIARPQVEAICAAIPRADQRDRVLFRLLVETGLRIGEALGLEVGAVDRTRDDEHLRVLGQGGRWRTVLLDARDLVRQIRRYRQYTGYRHGPLFRAVKNGGAAGLRYQSVQERWAGYCAAAGGRCSLHQLRHTHATELVNDGISLATIRKRLGHQRMETTLRYA
ncbi:MAG: tyrosine-type recombinase/integrase, partial [Chloroflexota bacterium]|nr:tyrosine-type recombinase/integrase [Chloroflexota bacterium]